ncbi:MAG: hypothetical protein NT105_23425 [Verrucomicrobia bacterium]|nr:hypothetical protein [Verrucomicrobiota bacterium]
MSKTLQTPECRAVEGALGRAGLDVTPRVPGDWHLTWKNGATHHAVARLEEDPCRTRHWLSLEAPLDAEATVSALDTSRLWDLLRWNGILAGNVKFALNAERNAVLRAELPVDAGGDLARRLNQVCDGFIAARARYRGEVVETCLNGRAASPPTLDLKQLCKEAGWPFAERSSGVLTVELEATHGVHHALMETKQERTTVSVVVTAMDSEDPDCRRAVAELLLTTCGIVRLARAAAIERDNTILAEMEVVFADAPAPFELSATLGSLSVACNLCAAEAMLLASDKDAASEFLTIRGWSAASQ